VTRSEAKKRVCAAVVLYLTNGMENNFLTEGYNEKDAARMTAAFEELMTELRRRGHRECPSSSTTQRRRTRGREND
jgi:hypothetical protein